MYFNIYCQLILLVVPLRTSLQHSLFQSIKQKVSYYPILDPPLPQHHTLIIYVLRCLSLSLSLLLVVPPRTSLQHSLPVNKTKGDLLSNSRPPSSPLYATSYPQICALHCKVFFKNHQPQKSSRSLSLPPPQPYYSMKKKGKQDQAQAWVTLLFLFIVLVCCFDEVRGREFLRDGLRKGGDGSSDEMKEAFFSAFLDGVRGREETGIRI